MDSETTIYLSEFLRTVLIIIDAFLLVFFIFLIIKAWKYKPNFRIGGEGEKIYTLSTAVLNERWESIVSRSRINSPESLRMAIIDADNFVDDVLKRMGLEGDSMASKEKTGGSMADRLENLSTDDFKTLNRLWAAHRVRNKIVHEPGFVVSREEAQTTLADYASFLKEVGAIKYP
ncbi:MAG: hypothetical protein AAB536_03495 [Patescibacteria group bacterium]